MKIKIIKCSSDNYWYKDYIGEIFNVLESESKAFKVEYKSICDYFVQHEDCKIINNTQQKIETLFDNFKEFLKEKNRRYGDSALHPIKIFSKVDAGNQIYNRLDDKLSRIKNANEIKKNDLADVFGYIALALIEKDWLDFDDLID
jgi:hypothetical protein